MGDEAILPDAEALSQGADVWRTLEALLRIAGSEFSLRDSCIFKQAFPETYYTMVPTSGIDKTIIFQIRNCIKLFISSLEMRNAGFLTFLSWHRWHRDQVQQLRGDDNAAAPQWFDHLLHVRSKRFIGSMTLPMLPDQPHPLLHD